MQLSDLSAPNFIIFKSFKQKAPFVENFMYALYTLSGEKDVCAIDENRTGCQEKSNFMHGRVHVLPSAYINSLSDERVSCITRIHSSI